MSWLTAALVRADSSDLWRVLSLADHNTRIAVLGAGFLGAAAGLVGTFLVLRRRALVSDTLGHSTLPGVAAAYLLLVGLGAAPRTNLVLLAGGALAAGAAAWLVERLRRVPRIHEDAALAIVLGVLFGLGLTFLGVVQQLGAGGVSGLDAFIDGSVATLTEGEAWTMVGLALAAGATTVFLFKELALLAFDPEQARLQGLPTARLELLQLALVVLVTVAGLRAVGLILIIALLVVPAAAARFWSDRLPRVAALAAGFGALSCVVGAWLSALVDHLPTGPLIVLTATLLFSVSLFFGSARGRIQRARTGVLGRNAGAEAR